MIIRSNLFKGYFLTAIMNESYRKILNESQTPFDETLDYVVYSILKNVSNKELVLDKVATKTAMAKYAAHSNPFDEVKEKYSKWKDRSRAVNYFKVLEPFDYKGKFIDPDHSIKTLIDSAEEVYLLIRDRISKTMVSKIYSTPIFHSKIEYDFWNKEFNNSLNKMVDSAEEVGLWIKYLSALEYDSRLSGMIKRYTNRKLRSIGIIDPTSAPKDFKIAAIYIKEYLKRLVNETPKLY